MLTFLDIFSKMIIVIIQSFLPVTIKSKGQREESSLFPVHHLHALQNQ